MYYYGQHFKNPKESKNTKSDLKFFIKNLYRLSVTNKQFMQEGSVVCSSYENLVGLFAKYKLPVVPVPWHTYWRSGIDGLNRCIHTMQQRLGSDLAVQLREPTLAADLQVLYEKLSELFYRHRGLIVPYDLPFFENMAIRACASAGRPSVVMLHGLPGRYNAIDDNRADWLAVWGPAIKECFVRAGVPANKIIVTGTSRWHGHPRALKFGGLDSVLLIAKTLPGGQPDSSQTIIADRSQTIRYALELRSVLEPLGVERVRFRPHPSENSGWYRAFLDPAWFDIDTLGISESLARSSLVIGPTSTVLIDALFAGRNYLVFEPGVEERGLSGFSLVPPFDGSDIRVPFARTAAALKELISSKAVLDYDLARDYAPGPVDASQLVEIFLDGKVLNERN